MPARVSGFNCSTPHLSILTNAGVADVSQSELLAAASGVVASQLSKPENYVMGEHRESFASGTWRRTEYPRNQGTNCRAPAPLTNERSSSSRSAAA